jgi:hypothetical protein
MNLDFGETLHRAWQITWKYRELWLFSLLSVIPVVFYLPLLFYFFLSTDFTKGIPDFFANPDLGLILLGFGLILVMVIISMVLRVFSNSATAFGIFQVVQGEVHLTSDDIIRGGQTYLWRILGVMVMTGIGLWVFFTFFSMFLSVIGFVTFGIGSLIGQILFFPARLFFYAVTEQSQAAVVADRMRPTDAILHAWKLVNENLGIFAGVTLILYVGLSLIRGLAMIPVMLPIFLVVLSKFTNEFSNPSFTGIAVLSFVVFLPVYLFVQTSALLYTKSAFMLTYLRLTRGPKLQPLPQIAEATS